MKLAIGANLPAIGFLDFNESHTEAAQSASATPDSPAFLAMLAQLDARNSQAARGERDYDRLTAVLFHEVPEPRVLQSLKDRGLDYHELPGNPYAPDARRRLPWCLFDNPIIRLSAEGGYLWGIGEDFGFLWTIFPEIEALLQAGKVKLVDRAGRANLERILEYLPQGARPASNILNYDIHDFSVMKNGHGPILMTSQAEVTRQSMTKAALQMGIAADRIIDVGYPGGMRAE